MFPLTLVYTRILIAREPFYLTAWTLMFIFSLTFYFLNLLSSFISLTTKLKGAILFKLWINLCPMGSIERPQLPPTFVGLEPLLLVSYQFKLASVRSLKMPLRHVILGLPRVSVP